VTTNESILDSERIRQLRLENGLSQRALSYLLGVSLTFVRHLERGGNHEQLTLRTVSRLAEVLGAEPYDLFLRDRSSADPSPDDVRVEALLANEGAALAAQEIAAAFGWPVRRVHDALAQLKRRLGSAGTDVWNGAGRYKLGARRAVLSDAERDRLARARLPRRGITRPQAQLLREIAAGTFKKSYPWASGMRHLAHQEQIALAALLKLSLIRLNEEGVPVLRHNVERSLHVSVSQ
jgi:transcriptional regulator with XRE-family HTH domain